MGTGGRGRPARVLPRVPERDRRLRLNASTPADSAPARAGAVLASLILVATVANLNLSVANVALPDIGRHFDASQISLNLVAVGFSVGLAASVLWLGAIGDSHGRKTMLVLGTALSLPTALAAAWAPSIEFLIVARVVGGVAAGMAFPTTLSLITALWSGAPRTRSIALWSAFGGASAALGPLIAGAVLVSFWWGSVFLITAPLVVVALVGAIVLVPGGVDESHERIDHFGGVLSVVAVAGVVLGINFAPEGGLGTQAVIASIVGVAAVGAFLLRQRRAPVPLYDLSVARRRTFWVAAVAGILVFGSLMGAIFTGQQYLQNVLGYSTWTAGLSAVPAAIVMIVLAPHSAKMVERYGSRSTLMAGYALLFLGFLVMLFLWRSATSFALVCVGYGFLGAGVALAGTPASRALTSAVPVERAGMASATADLQRDLGGAIMQSIFGALLTAGYIRAFDSRIDVTEQTQSISDQVAGQLTKSFSSAEATAAQFPQYASEITAAARESFVAGQRWSFLAGMVAMALGALVVRFGFPSREREIEMIAGYRRTDAADRLS